MIFPLSETEYMRREALIQSAVHLRMALDVVIRIGRLDVDLMYETEQLSYALGKIEAAEKYIRDQLARRLW